MSRNILRNFINSVELDGSFNILKTKNNGNWNWTSREKLLNNVNGCSKVLKDLNIKKGDRVAFKGKNSIEWLSWNLATYSVGGIWVPMYDQQEPNQIKYILEDSASKILISDQNFDDLKVNIIKTSDFEPNNKVIDIKQNELSNLIYTSGTTGNPKGVKLSHENILSNIDSIKKRFHDLPDNQISLNILPWAHIYGLTCELYYNLLNDNKVAICSDKTKLVNELKEVKPDVLYAVPKVLEVIKQKVSFLDKPIINNLLPFVLNRVFGGNLKNIFMGGAKLDDNSKKFYEQNNIIICEGYGSSELSPLVSVNHLTNPRDLNSIGKILDGVEVDIINNEICVSGPNVMEGYWNLDNLNKKIFHEKENKKFYRTGDSGFIIDNYLYYDGRISDNYKMSNGKFVNVNTTENKIKKHILNNFIIYGENMDHNILIVEKESDSKNSSSTNLLNKIDLINNDLESFINIKKIVEISPEEMAKFLTPKMSIKRKKLIKYVKEKNYI